MRPVSSFRPSLVVLLFPLLFAPACGGGSAHTHVKFATARPVSIQVEVYDPVTNWVWEGVSVRVAESAQEWSQCTCVSPYEDWYLTDSSGQVLLDEYVIAFADVGFLEDSSGRAVLGPRHFEDEATVWLEIDAVGFAPIFVEVPLQWDQPDVFIAVPFS